jgi:hypothetical protein
MEIFGGFMVMMSILGFFLVVVWLIMPFVVLTIKGKLDKTLDVLDGVEKRLTGIEEQLIALQNNHPGVSAAPADIPAATPGSDDDIPTVAVPAV